jgi:serine/threonine-protein phosphatase 2A activator
MLKMYRAEVLGKLPVIQHFLFGSILPYDGPISPPSNVDPNDPHYGHAHAHGKALPNANANGAIGLNIDGTGAAGQQDAGWGDCCGIPVPSVFAAAAAEKGRFGGRGLEGPGIRPIPFD